MARVVSGVLLAAVFFALIWFGNTTTLLIVALVVATLAAQEFGVLARNLGAQIPIIPTLAVTCAALIAVPFQYAPLAAIIPIGIIVLAVWVMAQPSGGPVPAEAGLKAGPSTVEIYGALGGAFASIYIGLPLGALVGIHATGGRGAVLLLMATVVVSDTAQFYTGRTFGRRPLAPTLSPKKTIEGAVGGFVLAPAFLAFAAPYFVPAATNRVVLAVLGVALVVAGIAGDLFESMLKRGAGMKDSSALIPGHGGVLDRIDALLFATPIFYLYVRELFA